VNKPRLAVGIDAGSSKTRCVVCLLENSRLQFLGYGEAPARGWAKSRITDQNGVAESIRNAVAEAERLAQVSVESAVVGIGGAAIEGANGRGVYEFGRPREVEAGDLGYAVERATRVRLEEDRLLLQVFPQDFTVDGRAGYRNPQGVKCSRLEANVHIITANLQEHQFLVAAVHQAHLAVEETVFEAMAAAYAAVLPEDRNRGVAVVDIGMHSTGITIYDCEALLLAASIPVGGDHFTKDVAWCLTTSYEDAEMLKLEYGCAILGLTSDHSLIEIPSPDGRPSREATRRQLNVVLEARAEELFEYVRAAVTRVGMEQSLLEGIVLCGGGARLAGMCDMAERVLNCQARNGLAIGIRDWPEELNQTEWTVAAGLSMYSARLKLKREQRRRAPGLAGMVLR
jgi:cell division protein FtsA